MKVTVIPKRPIQGILPKNKWIDREMELDLNKNEIKHCMQNAIVKDMNGTVIDELYVKKLSMHCILITDDDEDDYITTSISTTDGEPIIIDMKDEEIPEVVTSGYLEVVSEPARVEEEELEVITEPEFVEEVIPCFVLNVESCRKEDEHVILEIKMATNYKLEGALYGLFTIMSGPRPSAIEYKSGDNWIRFSNKFANFDTVGNDDRFVFRFIPKNQNEFTYRVSIKKGNETLVKLETKLNPSEL